MSAPVLAALGVLAAAGVGGVVYYSRRDETVTKPVTVFDETVRELERMTAPRGIRNNNPLNIRWNGVTQWVGLVGEDDLGFVIFDKPENGIRAAARVLATYRTKGLDTVAEIIDRWAPEQGIDQDGESYQNHTAGYIEYVAGALGMAPYEPVPRGRWPELLAAMIYFENGGNPYTLETIERGVMAA